MQQYEVVGGVCFIIYPSKEQSICCNGILSASCEWSQHDRVSPSSAINIKYNTMLIYTSLSSVSPFTHVALPRPILAAPFFYNGATCPWPNPACKGIIWRRWRGRARTVGRRRRSPAGQWSGSGVQSSAPTARTRLFTGALGAMARVGRRDASRADRMEVFPTMRWAK